MTQFKNKLPSKKYFGTMLKRGTKMEGFEMGLVEINGRHSYYVRMNNTQNCHCQDANKPKVN